MADVHELIALLKEPSVKDIALVSKAYHFAETAHKDHKRFSGEPYFNHLFETAKNLALLGMGPITVSAGLLHDSIEDVGVQQETIEREFGKEVLFLVEGVTKLGKLRYRGADRHIESLRKLFVAMSQDLRVLIIKLADRLHNMSTLQHVRPEKQRRIARETLEIYAPLAYRLGIRKMSRDLEDLSFPYVYPKEYQRVKDLMKQKSKERLKHLEKFHKSVIKALVKAGITTAHSYYRIKGLWSLYKKITRKDWDIDKVYDISALRIIVPAIEDCYRVLGAIHGTWRPLPGRIKDYIAFPKPNGYRGIHTTIFSGDGGIIEVQIRTEEIQREAEYGIASHFEYKDRLNEKKAADSNGVFWVKQFLPTFVAEKFGIDKKEQELNTSEIPLWIKQLGEVESNTKEHAEFIKNLKTDFFENRVFIFTPKGDVVDLPVDSSPIDFAYAIHSYIGDHIAGAKVNGKLVTLDKHLRNGDIVEIITKESAKPSAKWMDFARTTVARKHIKNTIESIEGKKRKEN
jgi:guanosine-3',5'-bis(diphosphate) 3'-pyrophosphohydrolase